MKYPNVLYTTLLSASLLVPFAIRLGLTEPYPAVLLPSGPGTTNATEDKIHAHITAIYGKAIGRDGWIRLSPARFLYPIPVEYFTHLAVQYFGLSQSAYRVLKVGGITIDTRRKTSEEDIERAKEWFRARLTENGCDDNLLRITREAVTFRRSNSDQLTVGHQDEKILDLH
jgi:hypothetical protein